MVRCCQCHQEKDESEMIFLYYEQDYICKDCNKNKEAQDDDEYLDYMYSIGE